jgi:membrane protein
METDTARRPPARAGGRSERAMGRLLGWLSRNRVTRLPWAVIQTFSDAQGALLAGSMAYFTFLSLPPLLMLAGSVLGGILHANPSIVTALSEAAAKITPDGRGREVLDQLSRARVALGLTGLAALMYAGTGFVGTLTGALNRLWDVPPSRRNPVLQKVLNLLVVTLMGVILLGSTALTIWLGQVSRNAPVDSGRTLARWLQLVASPALFLLVVLMLYRLLPARFLSWRSQLPGALFAVLGVEILKRAFSFWASHSSGLAVLPRSLLSVVILLIWLGFLSQLLLYGAAVNVVAERRRDASAVPG